MNIHYLKHVELEGLGYIESWLNENKHSITCTKLYKNEDFPALNQFEWLIIMGGPMGVYEEDKYPWLKKEKEFIRNAIKSNKIVLGICLGAQLIASALGYKVYKNKYKEIGWFPIYLTKEGKKHPLFKNFPEKFVVFHWHGDTFDIPEKSIHLAYSEATEKQAFLYNKKVLGLQFHFEITKEIVKEWAENEIELKPDKFVQNEKDIIQLSEEYALQNNSYMKKILEYLSSL